MVIDQPTVSWKQQRKSERSMFGTKKEVDEMEALADAWTEANKGKSMVGKNVSLSDFVSGGDITKNR